MARSAYRLRAVIGVPARLAALAPVLEGLDVPQYALDKWALSEVVGFRVTRGVLASADRLPPADPAQLVSTARRVAVLEGLNDFENIGALFRNAAAFGVEAVLLDPRCADPLYRRSVRVSMGHVLQVPFGVLPDPPTAAMALLREHGLRTVALSPGGESDLRAVPTPERWAVLLGAEGPGLSPATLSAADVRARIPMADGVDSLNVATAAAVAFALLG